MNATGELIPPAWPQALASEVGRTVIGHDATVHRLLVALLTGGHVLLEGLPGLAKTLAAQVTARASGLSFRRIQFTPDLLPADVTGTLIYDPARLEFAVHFGPVFANIVLADEINRAPARVQSALLEAMQEGSVTLGRDTHPLPAPFIVLATQNPFDHEGTFPLPEAQLDRFLFKLRADYPTREHELDILRLHLSPVTSTVTAVLDADVLLESRRALSAVYVDEAILDYVQRLASATRWPGQHGVPAVQALIRTGISPRAAARWLGAARAAAYLAGRQFVVPDDVVMLAKDVMRHRLLLSLDAEADNVSTDEVVDHILRAVAKP